MKRVRKIAAVALLLALSTVPAARLQAAPMPAASDPLAAGRALTAQFLGGEVAALWDRMTPELQASFGSQASFAAFRDRVKTAGKETELLGEQTQQAGGGLVVYTRRARFSNVPVPVLVQWMTDARGRIAGLLVKPEGPTR